MLQISEVSLQQGARPCLDSISLELRSGELLVLAGPNGAGKSSLLRVASGEWLPDRGEARLDGQNIATLAAADRACRMAILPQASRLDFDFRAEEVVALGRMPHSTGRARDAEVVTAAMRMLGVDDLATQSYPRLSGGEQRRVQLARVLAQVWPESEAPRPRVLLLDEPTAGLDWAHRLDLLQNLRRLAAQAGLAVLLVLHDLNLALRHADRVALLRHGRLRSVGTPREVLTPAAIREVFAVEVLVQDHPLDGRPVIL